MVEVSVSVAAKVAMVVAAVVVAAVPAAMVATTVVVADRPTTMIGIQSNENDVAAPTAGERGRSTLKPGLSYWGRLRQ